MKSIFKTKDLKYVPAFLVVLVIGIALLGTWREDKETQVIKDLTQVSSKQEEVIQTNELDKIEISLEQRLEKTLSQIKDVGEVDVIIFLASGPKYDYAVNVSTVEKQVNEKDQSGGTRSTTEVTEDGQLVVLKADGTGGETPVVAQEYKPLIQGVLVVAQGADNPKIKAKLLTAVSTILDLESHKVDIQSKE